MFLRKGNTAAKSTKICLIFCFQELLPCFAKKLVCAELEFDFADTKIAENMIKSKNYPHCAGDGFL